MAYTETKKVQISIPLDKADIEIGVDDSYEELKIEDESHAYLVLDGMLEMTAWQDPEDPPYRTLVERGHLSVTTVGLRII